MSTEQARNDTQSDLHDDITAYHQPPITSIGIALGFAGLSIALAA